MMTYFLRNKQTGVMEFVYFLLNDNTLSPTADIHRININIFTRDATLSAFTVVEGVTYPSVMTICKYFAEKLGIGNSVVALTSRNENTHFSLILTITYYNCLQQTHKKNALNERMSVVKREPTFLRRGISACPPPSRFFRPNYSARKRSPVTESLVFFTNNW